MTNFDSLLDTQVSAQPGTYNLYLDSYKIIPEVVNLTDPDPDSERNTSYLIDPTQPADAVIRQAYLLLTTNNPLISIRIYPKRVQYLMNCLNRQFHYTTSAMRLSQLLEYIKTHQFSVKLYFDPRYGEQYDFYFDVEDKTEIPATNLPEDDL